MLLFFVVAYRTHLSEIMPFSTTEYIQDRPLCITPEKKDTVANFMPPHLREAVYHAVDFVLVL